MTLSLRRFCRLVSRSVFLSLALCSSHLSGSCLEAVSMGGGASLFSGKINILKRNTMSDHLDLILKLLKLEGDKLVFGQNPYLR